MLGFCEWLPVLARNLEKLADTFENLRASNAAPLLKVSDGGTIRRRLDCSRELWLGEFPIFPRSANLVTKFLKGKHAGTLPVTVMGLLPDDS